MKTIKNQTTSHGVYDDQCFYRRSLGPVLIQFFMRLKRNKKKQLKLARERCRSREVIICPQNVLNCAVLEHLLCSI